jgi:hypothetical protein
MKTLHLSIIVASFALVLILPSTAFATMLSNNNEVLKQFDTNSNRMTKLVHDGAILITTQTIEKTEYKLGEKILIHPTLTNIGNKSMNISYMWHPFFFVINNQNGSAVWANGPSVPMMEYSSNLNQTLEPNVPFTGAIHDVEDPRYPTVLDTPGNYSISSVADFYGYGTPRNLVWSEPIKFTVLPEQYSVTDMNMPPPLQQFLAGIPATSVKCWDGLELLIKTNTGLPICVKHYTATKMIERDWAKKAPSQIPVVIMPPGFDDLYSGKTYDPSSINVVIGINNTVRWTNKASSSDTLTSDGFKESNSFGEIFGGSTLRPGDTYEFTFTKAGIFGYHGVPNSWNKGKIIVLPHPIQSTTQPLCDTQYKPRETQHVTFPNGTSLTTNYVPVFLMKSNSTGKICITNNIASQSTDQSSISAKTTSRVSKDDSETSDVIVVPYPENIIVDNTTKTIVYTITTSNVANGFYRISTTFDFCGSGIPLAVGYNSSHLFDNDFPWLGQTIPCPFNSFQSVQTQITGLTGIDVAYITKEYR